MTKNESTTGACENSIASDLAAAVGDVVALDNVRKRGFVEGLGDLPARRTGRSTSRGHITPTIRPASCASISANVGEAW